MEFAQRLLAFLKATLIGGVFVLAPIMLLMYVVGQAFKVVHQAIQPLLQWLPSQTVGGVSLVMAATMGLLIAACFLAGLIANTAIAKWLVRSIESAILTHLPGYTLMKSMGEGIVGVNNPDGRKAVLVHFGERSQVGFLMDRVADGRLIVFIPNVPSPWSGTLHIVPTTRVERLEIPIRLVIEQLQRLGDGLGGNLPAAPGASPPE